MASVSECYESFCAAYGNIDDRIKQEKQKAPTEERSPLKWSNFQGIEWRYGYEGYEFWLYRADNASLQFPSSRFTHNQTTRAAEWADDFTAYVLKKNYPFCDPCISHFQLRNNIKALSNDVVCYTCRSQKIKRLHMTAEETTTIYSCVDNFMPTTMSCTNEVCVVGGYNGDIVVQPMGRLDRKSASTYFGQQSVDSITNHVQITSSRTHGSPVAVWCNNDHIVRDMHLETLQVVHECKIDFAPNCTAASPDSRLRVVVGDAQYGLIMATDENDVVSRLDGHEHDCFAAAWGGHIIATGSQDLSTKLYDIRKANKAFASIPSAYGPPRSLAFTSDNRYLVIGEAADYVQIRSLDPESLRTNSRQQISFYGHVSGVSLSPDDDQLFVAVSDDNLGSIFKCDRVKPQAYGVNGLII